MLVKLGSLVPLEQARATDFEIAKSRLDTLAPGTQYRVLAGFPEDENLPKIRLAHSILFRDPSPDRNRQNSRR
jgi:hypothetical protein